MHIPLFPFSKTLRVAALVASAVLLQACSTVKLAYNQAPQLLSWQLNRYLDLSQPQAERVRDELADLHRWHRDTLLPEHAVAEFPAWETLPHERIEAGLPAAWPSSLCSAR